MTKTLVSFDKNVPLMQNNEYNLQIKIDLANNIVGGTLSTLFISKVTCKLNLFVPIHKMKNVEV